MTGIDRNPTAIAPLRRFFEPLQSGLIA
jgi:hypothetical protein